VAWLFYYAPMAAPSRRLLYAVVVLSACGGGNPAAPIPTRTQSCPLVTMQCILDRASVSITVNGVSVDVGSTTTAAAGSPYSVRVDYTYDLTGAEANHFAILSTRDDGIERFIGCFGGGGSGPGSGGFGASSTIPVADAGHTLRVFVVGGFGPRPTPGGGSPCILRTSTGQLIQPAIQGRRDLMMLMVP
jgi:hypothetical protein